MNTIYSVPQERGPSALTPHDAAAWFAHDYFTPARAVARFSPPGDNNPLATNFQLVNGSRWYRAEFDDDTYKVRVLGGAS